jgi:hypothetical protein
MKRAVTEVDSAQVVDDDVDEPGAKSAAILLLFVLHLLLLRGDG